MKADVLEQIVDDYLKFNGYFTTHNVVFRPSKDHPDYDTAKDGGYSDVDVLGHHPNPPKGRHRVVVVSCKAWQDGFNTSAELAALRRGGKSHGKDAWKSFRELWVPKWSEAFHTTVTSLTGESTFSYQIAVTYLRGIATAQTWAQDPIVKSNLRGCGFSFLTLEEMGGTMLKELTTAPASSEIGRLAQLLRAAGLTASEQVSEPMGPVPGSAAALAEEAENLEEDAT